MPDPIIMTGLLLAMGVLGYVMLRFLGGVIIKVTAVLVIVVVIRGLASVWLGI